MQLNRLFLIIFTLLATVKALADQGDKEDTTKQTATTIWVTLTTKGSVVTVPTTYLQSFKSREDNTDDFKSGLIGLGSKGDQSVGQIRTYAKTTVSNPNAGNSVNGVQVYSGLLGFVAIAIGLL